MKPGKLVSHRKGKSGKNANIPKSESAFVTRILIPDRAARCSIQGFLINSLFLQSGSSLFFTQLEISGDLSLRIGTSYIRAKVGLDVKMFVITHAETFESLVILDDMLEQCGLDYRQLL